MKNLRCAIYTRKSTEERLDKDFNSLDAQREACDAYITSQKQEGWRPLATLCDNGGFSRGRLERPAMQRLLTDIAERKIDVVVVYKVDRLTRALADFAKIVEVFDAKSVSFVSVIPPSKYTDPSSFVIPDALQHSSWCGAVPGSCLRL